MIDPTKYGATRITPAKGGIDPTKYGATKVGATGFPSTAPTQVSQSFTEKLNSFLSKPVFDMSQNQSGLVGTTAKSAVNTVQSFGKFAKGTVDFLNPKNALETVRQLPGAVSGFAQDASAAVASEKQARQLEERVRQMTGKASVAQPLDPQSITPKLGKALYESTAPPAVQEAFKGNITDAIEGVAEDPYQLAPLFFMAKGFAEAKTIKTGKTTPEGAPEYKSLLETELGKKIDAGISRASGIVTKPITVPAKGALKIGKSLAKFGTSQATGLSPKTIETLINNPKDFSAVEASKYTREGIASEVKQGIDSRIADLQETGKGYEAVRTGVEKISISPEAVNAVLDKYRIKVGPDGKIITSQESLPLSAGDRAALQDFVAVFNTTQLSPNAFLNARTALSNMAKFDATKTNASTTLARELRTVYDTAGKDQIKGLKELDKIYSAEKEILTKIKRDYLQADGTFKDGAVSKISNLNRAGREQILSRLENIVPGIGKKLTILNALEDIANTQGQKVGTYGRALLGGAGLATGNLAAIVAAILASPAIASQILRGYGRLRGVSSAVIEKAIKTVEQALKTDLNDKVGLSIKDTGNSYLNRLNKYEAEAMKKAKAEVKKKPKTPTVEVRKNDSKKK